MNDASTTRSIEPHHCQVCGKWGSFGVGPSGDYRLIRDHPERIRWYCFEHCPDRPAKTVCDSPPAASTSKTEKPPRQLKESWAG
jgi:hypothetical protein